jgi:hypothetical protein
MDVLHYPPPLASDNITHPCNSRYLEKIFSYIDHNHMEYLYIITFMVLYSIIKPYNSFFVINRHIARHNFILDDLFSGRRNPVKILKFTYTSQTFSTSVAMTSHKHKQKVAHKFYKRKQNANINLYTSN